MYQHGIRKLDQLVITYDDLDHSENKEVLQIDFKAVVSEKKGEPVPYFVELMADEEYEDVNDNSRILLSHTGILFTGDAGVLQERALIKKYDGLKVNVLKCGHHGSKTSSDYEFLKILAPRYAIISSKPKVYGHPHSIIMRRLYNLGIRDIQTSKEGDITFLMTPFFQFIITSQGMFGIIEKVIQ